MPQEYKNIMFVISLKPPMNKSRIDLITKAYTKLDKNSDGKFYYMINLFCLIYLILIGENENKAPVGRR